MNDMQLNGRTYPCPKCDTMKKESEWCRNCQPQPVIARYENGEPVLEKPGTQGSEQEKIDEVQGLLARPLANFRDSIGVIDEATNKPKYFDPWDIFPLYGSYSSEFDDMAIHVLTNLLNSKFDDETLAHELFREILCKKNLCDYGTSPRTCFPTERFNELLPEYLVKWKQYYKLTWGEKYDC